MKKIMIACAVVLSAAFFASCGDTNHCYEVTYSYGSIASTTVYVWGTDNDLDAQEAQLKETAEKIGATDFNCKHKIVNKSQDDCKGGGLKF